MNDSICTEMAEYGRIWQNMAEYGKMWQTAVKKRQLGKNYETQKLSRHFKFFNDLKFL